MTIKSALLSLFLIGTATVSANSGAFASNLQLSSPTLKNGTTMKETQVFNGFGCSGQNISPELSWSGAPGETQYYAITVYDPDAPTGSGWWHWAVVNIPASVTSLAENAGAADGSHLPAGALQTMTDFGKPGYNGACPPAGSKPHRYEFTVYALKDKVPADGVATPAMAGFYINSLKLSKDKITVTYSR